VQKCAEQASQAHGKGSGTKACCSHSGYANPDELSEAPTGCTTVSTHMV